MPTQLLATGVELYYEVHGSGEPIVLLPATGFAGNVWNEPYQLPGLAESNQVIIFDPRGCGRSTRYEGVYTIEQMGQDVIALLDHLSIEAAHLVGHSMGGRIALSIALDAPRRVTSMIMAASGSGPAARDGDDCVAGLPFRLVDSLVELGFDKYLEEEILDSATYFSDEYRATHPKEVALFYEIVAAQHAPRDCYIRLCQARHNFEATHRLGDVRVPTLVLVGDLDTVGSNHVSQSEALKRIPGSQYRMLAGQSHGFFWERPDDTNALIKEWVDAHSRTS